MFATFLITIIAIVFLWVYFKWSQVKRHWADRGVPHEPPNPLYGSLSFMMKMNGLDFFVQQYQKYAGLPYFGMWLFWRPVLMIRDPEIVKRVLITDFNLFKDRLAGVSSHDSLAHTNLLFAREPLWTPLRRSLTPVFTSAKLRSLQKLFSEKAKNLETRIIADQKKGKKVELRELFADYSTDLLASAAFGVADRAILTRDSALRNITNNLMKFTPWRAMCWASIFFCPELSGYFRFTFAPKNCTDYLRKYIAKAIEQKGGWDRKDAEVKDLLDALLDMKRKAIMAGEEWDEDHLIAQVLIFIQAGFETTTITQTFIFYELAHNPDIQQRLYEELKKAKEELGDKDFDSEILSNLTYLDCVIKESMRKFPVIAYTDRVAKQKYKIDDKLTIEKGATLFMCMSGLHLDGKHWPNPKKFDPDRFLPENKHKITPYTYFPFGDGPRNCIGMRFAKQAMAYSISTLILAFEVRPPPGMPSPDDIKLDWKSTLSMPAQELYLDFVPRDYK